MKSSKKSFYRRFHQWNNGAALVMFTIINLLIDYIITPGMLGLEFNRLIFLVAESAIRSSIILIAIRLYMFYKTKKWENSAIDKEHYAFHPFQGGLVVQEGHLYIKNKKLVFANKTGVEDVDVKSVFVDKINMGFVANIFLKKRMEALWINGDKTMQYVVDHPHEMKERIEREVINR